MSKVNFYRGALAAITMLLAASCSASRGPSLGAPGTAAGLLPGARPATGHPASGSISHIVVIIQENRSFENFFAGYPGANAPMYGCAETPSGQARIPAVRSSLASSRRMRSSSTCPHGDTQVPLTKITFNGPDLRHDWDSSMTSWDNGNMDGFSYFGKKHGKYEAYSYVNENLVAPYWQMAQQYVLADAMYPTEFGGSFTGHLTLVAGTDDLTPSKAEVDFPNGLHDDCDSPPGTKSSFLDPKRRVHRFNGPFPCFDQFNTMAQVLDAGGISWKFYASKVLDAGMWSPFEAIKYVRYGPDWGTNMIAPQTQVLSDAANSQLASVSWVTPSRPDSDHPAYHSDKGPSWVASVVNAIGESPYWDSTAIIVVWDDWGGWFDSAPPPQLDYRGLGIRVPCLIISPYAKQGYVDDTQYEFGSVLRFMEEAFNLPYIGSPSDGYTDERAAPLDNAFDFTQKPRAFKPIGAKYPISEFLHEPPSYGPLDTQ